MFTYYARRIDMSLAELQSKRAVPCESGQVCYFFAWKNSLTGILGKVFESQSHLHPW